MRDPTQSSLLEWLTTPEREMNVRKFSLPRLEIDGFGERETLVMTFAAFVVGADDAGNSSA
jgi:hypothetical protein